MKGHRLQALVYSLIIFLLLPVTSNLSSVFAQADALGKAQITAASPLYFLKSIREILELKFAGTTRVRALRKLEFATRRIREVKSLVKTSREDLIEPTLENYVSYIQELKGSVHPNDKEMVNTVNGNIATQTDVLQEVFKQVSDPKAKRSIRLTIFRISEKYESSKPSACNFLQREASSSALNEVGRTVYLERAKKCQAVNP